MGPLTGFKVVEFSTYVVVPIAARVLGDWGAEVIKIESADGDAWRTHGDGGNLPTTDDCNPAYATCNSGKRFISLNLKAPEGREALLKILATADVFMTNIRWAGIERLGLDYDTLHAMFPRLVYCHFTGYGYEGPDKDRPGFDTTGFWSMSGMLHELHEPGTRPTITPPAFGDTSSSNSIISGIVAALLHRERTGEGMRVTSSLFANGIWCNHSRIVSQQEREDGSTPPSYPTRAADTKQPFSGIYECKDGEWMQIGGVLKYQKDPKKYLNTIGLGQYAEDERFLPDGLKEHSRFVYDTLVEYFKTKTAAEWNVLLTENDISHQELFHSGNIAKSEQAWANDYLCRMTCPDGRTYVMPKSPVTFFGFEKPDTQHPGPVGSDTSAVLAEFGYSAEQIQDLFDRGIAAGK